MSKKDPTRANVARYERMVAETLGLGFFVAGDKEADGRAGEEPPAMKWGSKAHVQGP